MAIEKTKYKTIEVEDHFELRQYDSYIVAETMVEGEFSQVSNIGFRKLAGYIFGGNTSSKKIAMTAPVGLERKSGKFGITFSMPSSYTLDSLPVPNDQTIELKVVPERMCAVIRFSGVWNESRYQANLNKLNHWIMNKSFEKIGEPIFARYNPPWTPWFLRKNEILIPVSKKLKA